MRLSDGLKEKYADKLMLLKLNIPSKLFEIIKSVKDVLVNEKL